MDAPIPTALRWPRGFEGKLLALALALFLIRNLPYRLDDYDQAKQAFASLEIAQAGHVWFQHTPGFRLVATKPPLEAWASALLHPLAGWEVAWRLPSFAAAVTLLALLWLAGEKLWPGAGGALAAAAFGLNMLAPRLATLARTDMLLTLWIMLAGVLIWRKQRDASVWTVAERWQLFGCLLAGIWTKGPIVYAFLVPGIAACALILHFRGQPTGGWGGWAAWTLPLAPFAVWVQRGIVTVPHFFDEVVKREFMGRFTVGEAAVHHNQPIYFYFAHLLLQWAPWSVLFLAVRFLRWGTWTSILQRRDTLWLVGWAFGGLVFMSFVPSKRVDRIFPAVPPLSLLLAALNAQLDPAWGQRLRRWALMLGAIIATVSAVGSAAISYRHGEGQGAAFAAQAREIVGDSAGEVVTFRTDKDSNADDETMLVNMRHLEFLAPLKTIQQISVHDTKWLVMRAEVRDKLRGSLDPYGPWKQALTSSGTPQFVLLVRR